MTNPIVQKAIDKITQAYKPIVERKIGQRFTVHGVPESCPGCGMVMPRSAYAVAQLAMGNTLKYMCPELQCKAKITLVR